MIENKPALSSLQRWLLLFIILGSFALRLHELTRQDIWWDEARNIDVALRPIGQVAIAPELDIHPPVYFWLLHAWGRIVAPGVHVQTGEFALPPEHLAFLMRFPSLCFGVLGVALLYSLAARCAPVRISARGAGIAAAAVAAVSPFWLAESQETRMYTVGMVWLLAAAVAFVTLLDRWTRAAAHAQPDADRQLPAVGSLAAFALFSALAFLTHYNALFILVAWYGWWGVWALWQPNRWRHVRTLLITGLVSTALVLPIAPIALRQIPGYANPNLTVPSLPHYLIQNWQAHVGGYAFDAHLLMLGAQPVGNLWLWGVLFVLCGGLVLASGRAESGERGLETGDRRPETRFPAPNLALRTQNSELRTQNSELRTQNSELRTPHAPLSFLLVWLLGGLGLYYIAVLDRGAFNPRYSSFVTPALFALVGIALMGWRRAWRPLAWIGALVVITGMAVAARADLHDARVAREDVAGLAQWLRENTGSGDLILVDQKYPFGFYYERYAIDAAETPVGPEAAPARYLFVDINTLDQRLTEWARDAQRVFWVRWFESDTDPRRGVTFLLDNAGRRAGEKAFRGYEVDWWKLSPPNQFDLAANLQPATHIFPPAVETVEVALPAEPVKPGAFVPLVIRWKLVTEGRTDRPLKARLALHEPGGSRILGQDDRPILNDRHLLPAEWSTEDRPLNVYTVPIPADLPPGAYEIRLLIYDAETLAPLTYVDLAGNPAGIEATLGRVRVTNDQ
jgi:hypothetical protein